MAVEANISSTSRGVSVPPPQFIPPIANPPSVVPFQTPPGGPPISDAVLARLLADHPYLKQMLMGKDLAGKDLAELIKEVLQDPAIDPVLYKALIDAALLAQTEPPTSDAPPPSGDNSGGNNNAIPSGYSAPSPAHAAYNQSGGVEPPGHNSSFSRALNQLGGNGAAGNGASGAYSPPLLNRPRNRYGLGGPYTDLKLDLSVPPLMPTPGRNPNLAQVDPRLLQIVAGGAQCLPAGYKATINEGYNPNGHAPNSQHHNAGSGAIDVLITDPQGHQLSNRGADPTGMYALLARGAYTYMLQYHPELKGRFAWGGAFGTVPGGGTSDLMHYDLGGERGHIEARLLSHMGPLPAGTFGPMAHLAPLSNGGVPSGLGSLANYTAAPAPFAPEVEHAIAHAALETGVPVDWLRRIAKIESSGNPSARTGKYCGLLQLSQEEFQKHGGGNIYSAFDNATAGARKIAAESREFANQHGGRAPSLTEIYMTHQQGTEGAAKHFANLDAPAWMNMARTGEGRQKGDSWARRAIWGNIPNYLKPQFGDVDHVSSRAFVEMWAKKLGDSNPFGNRNSAVASNAPKPSGKEHPDKVAQNATPHKPAAPAPSAAA